MRDHPGQKPSERGKTIVEAVEFARPAIGWKERAIGSNPLNAMNPTVQAWRDGKLLATITAPNCDRDQGFQAAHLARISLRADRIVAAFDTFMKEEKPAPGESKRLPGETAQEQSRRILKARPRIAPGTFQRMFEDEYTRERELVKEDIFVVDARNGGDVFFASLPFLMDQRFNPARVVWHQAKFLSQKIDEESGTVGPLIDNIRAIVNQPFNQELFELSERDAVAMGMEGGRKDFFRDRGVFTFLRGMGFDVEDHITPLHPEWLREG